MQKIRYPFQRSPHSYSSSFKDFNYLLLERGKEGERKGEKHQCVVASHASPTGDLACNPGMCPNWELLVTLWFPGWLALNPLSHTSQGPSFVLGNYSGIAPGRPSLSSGGLYNHPRPSCCRCCCKLQPVSCGTSHLPSWTAVPCMHGPALHISLLFSQPFPPIHTRSENRLDRSGTTAGEGAYVDAAGTLLPSQTCWPHHWGSYALGCLASLAQKECMVDTFALT